MLDKDLSDFKYSIFMEIMNGMKMKMNMKNYMKACSHLGYSFDYLQEEIEVETEMKLGGKGIIFTTSENDVFVVTINEIKNIGFDMNLFFMDTIDPVRKLTIEFPDTSYASLVFEMISLYMDGYSIDETSKKVFIDNCYV